MRILDAGEEDMPKVRELFCEYRDWLGVDLCFQGFDEELATLPGNYSPPRGFVLLAVDGNNIVGCVGIRPRHEREAELKRLYVRANHQGQGVGKRLFHHAMLKARDLGYTSVVLDTLPTMSKARSLYLAYGFEEIAPYYDNPEEGAEYYRHRFGGSEAGS